MTDAFHETRFPGESDDYRRERNSLLAAEIELRRATEAVAAQRRGLPLGGAVPHDYAFASEAGSVRLSELFAPGKDSLVLYSFMFLPDGVNPLGRACPSCTSIIDAVDGSAPHVAQRINIAVAAKVPIEQLAEHARNRGWRNVRLLSSAEATYNRDYHAETDEGSQLPIATVFVRRDGGIHHSWSSELMFAPRDPGEHPRHVDFMWPVWSIFDLTPDGRSTDWEPRLSYE